MTETRAQQSTRPGQMTAVMRAAALKGPRVLRVGVVVGGKVVEERVFVTRKNITIGPSEKSNFVLSSQAVRKNHVLFERRGEGYSLNFLDAMTGRVALPTGVSDLAALRARAKRGPAGSYRVKLTDDSRGKVVVGETTFLFQFVEAPFRKPKPQLPAAALRGASGIDWRTTIIAAFAFFGHFMAIGAMYSDWLDPVLDEEASLAGLIETLERLPPPPEPEEKAPEEDSQEQDSEEVDEKPEKEKPSADTRVPDTPGQKLNQAQTAALSNELEQLSMMTLAAFGGEGPATAGVLQDGNVSTTALDAAASSGAGVGVGGDLKLGGGGGPIQPGKSAGLDSIGSKGKGSSESGTSKAVKGPKGSSQASSNVAVGTVSGASRVVARMNAGFRRCYQRGLDQNPDISGSIRLTIQVGPGGGVSSVSGGATGSIPASVVRCVKNRARAAQFSPPDGGSAVIHVPISFVKQ